MSCTTSTTEECVSVVPSEVCLELVKDADTTFEFTLTDGKSVPVDITADTVQLNVRDKIGGTSKLAKSNAPGSHSDPTSGKTQFTISDTDITDTLLPHIVITWVYEVRRIQASGAEAVHIMGKFIVHLSVGG